MSYQELFRPVNMRGDTHGPKIAYTKALAGRISWAALAITFFVVTASVEAPAAELGAMNVHAKAYRHYKRVAYEGCRTGWWQTYWDGMPRPHWATRCSR